MATVTAGKTWASGDVLNVTNMNYAANPTVVLADSEVTTAKINDGAVTTAKINDAAITTIKLADSSSTTTGVTNSKLRQSAALSVIGNATNATAAPADMTASADGHVLRRSGTTIGFGTLATAGIADAAITPAKLSQPLTFSTAQNSTSGTSLTFTGIPSWAKRITVIFNGVSTTGASGDHILVRVGTSSGLALSGYSSSFGNTSNGGQATAGSTTGFGVWHNNASDTTFGHVMLTLLSGTTWVASGAGGYTASTSNFMWTTGGSVSLSGPLDRVAVTSVNGTDTFDAGSINISYEG